MLFRSIVIALARNLGHSTHGRALFAIRDDEVAAEALGVDTTRYKVTAFVLGAFFAGVTAPMLLALEPYGVGLVRFGVDGVLPLWPRAVYGLLSAVALAGLLTLLWRRWRDLPNAAVVFPSLVLWFSWRSAQNYFGFAGVFSLIGDETMLADDEPVPLADGIGSGQ